MAVALAAEDEKKHAEKPAEKTAEKIAPADAKKDKRGVFGLGYGYAAAPLAYSSGYDASYSNYGSVASLPSNSYVSGVNTHTNTVITKEVPVGVPQPYPVTVEKHVPYPVYQKVTHSFY